MSYQFLHRLVVLAILRLPNVARAIARSGYQPLLIFRDSDCAYRYFVVLRVELPRFVLREVPNAHPSTLIAEVDFALVWVQDSRVDHNAIVVEISHKATRLEVEHFQGAILARCEKPLVVLLELYGSDIARVALLLASQVDD